MMVTSKAPFLSDTIHDGSMHDFFISFLSIINFYSSTRRLNPLYWYIGIRKKGILILFSTIKL